MDYWLGNQRAKGEVLVMGKPGAKVRFAALSPAGGSTIAEMACDGTSFALRRLPEQLRAHRAVRRDVDRAVLPHRARAR